MIFAGLGVAVYLLMLLVTIPAALVVPLAGAAGTIWHGTAPVGAGQAEWHWSPLRSLLGLGFAVDFTVDGPATALKGQALVGPRRTLLENIRGEADGALLAALVEPPFACTVQMRLDIDRVAIGGGAQGGAGRVRGEPGSCQAPGNAPVATPPLLFDVRQTPGLAVINLAPAGDLRRPFLVGGLAEDGKLRLIVTPEGAAALPFLSPPGGMKIETEL